MVVLLLTLAAFYLVMSPPLEEMGLMAAFLSFTAVVSVASGYGAYRWGWIQRSPRIRWTLLGVYALSSGLTFVNVWVTASLMFASPHDLRLATLLLVFATAIALSLGYLFLTPLTETIVTLNEAADEIAQGHLHARVSVSGRDEMAELARSFNKMASQLQTAAQERERLEEMRRNLIAWIGHDLRTPLASIRAIVEALADGVVEDPESIHRYLRTAQRDIRSLSALIDDLFQMAQLDAGGLHLDRSPNSIADLISNTLESFSELAAQQEVVLEGSIEPGIEAVWMDVQRMERVLANLVKNALRHTPSGGRIEVRAESFDESIRVQVWDTGEGIPAEDLPHIFDQFYRGEKSRNRATGGAGLGLAIARGIVQAHGGEIDVESEVGKGTCFSILLPKEGSE
jgi:signal transduction histidine kinase